MPAAVWRQSEGLRVPAVGGIPHRGRPRRCDAVGRHPATVRPDLDDASVDRQAHIDPGADEHRRSGVGHAVHLDQRHRRPDDPGLPAGRVEPRPGQGGEQELLGRQPLGGGDTGCPVGPGVDLSVEPRLGPAVELADGVRGIRHDELLEKGLLELAERALALSFPLGVARCTGLEGEAVVGGELQRLRAEAEGPASRRAECAHAVAPSNASDAAHVLEEPHQPLEGAGAIDRRGEPPVPAAAEAEDGAEAVELAKVPQPAPVVAVGPVELELLAGGGLDRHAHLGRPTPPDAPHPAQVAHERR